MQLKTLFVLVEILVQLVSKWITLFVLFLYCSLRFSLSWVHSDSIRCSTIDDDDDAADDDDMDDNNADGKYYGDIDTNSAFK